MRIYQVLFLSIWAQETSSELEGSRQNLGIQSRSSDTGDRSTSRFVYAPGDGNLYLKGRLFNFRTFNTPTIFQGGEFQSRDILKSIAGFGTPVTRTYTLKISNENFEYGRLPSSEGHVTGWDNLTNDWIYNEHQWRKIDQVLDLSRRYGVKLIIPIINQDYSNPASNYVGTYVDLIRHRYNIYEYRAAGDKIDFFTDPNMIYAFKKLINFFLNRINTFNGIRYGDDHTILAFETGNELNWANSRRRFGPPPGNWTIEIARSLKNLAPKILVMDGSYSRNPSIAWRTEALESAYVDLFSYHFYGGGDTESYDLLNSKIRAYGKTLIIGEHGFYSDVSVYRQLYRKMACAGALVWSLLPHSEEGGFLTHSEGYNTFGYHVPGWSKQSSREFDTRESEVISLTYEASYTILGLEPPPKPVPGPPEAFIVRNATHAGLSWRGAAWAAGYEIFGAEPSSHFHLISNDIPDNLEAGQLFVPLNPEKPTETINIIPREPRPQQPHDGWVDKKWDWWGSTPCCHSHPILDKLIEAEQKDNFENIDAVPTTITSLPIHPMRKRVRGGWYAVRGVSADGVHGRHSKPVFLEADWADEQSG